MKKKIVIISVLVILGSVVLCLIGVLFSDTPVDKVVVTSTISPTNTLEPTNTSISPTIKPVEKCDFAYPDFCIPPPSPDLDCKDITEKKFKVLPPDPHGFDTDGDGIGCES